MSDAAQHVTDEMVANVAEAITEAEVRAALEAVAGDIAAAVRREDGVQDWRRHERVRCAAELDELAGMPSPAGGTLIPAWYRTRLRAVAERWRAGP